MFFLMLLASFETEHEARTTIASAANKLPSADLDLIKLFFLLKGCIEHMFILRVFNYGAKAKEGSYIIISIPYTITISIV